VMLALRIKGMRDFYVSFRPQSVKVSTLI
jgi:hypothetical protein